MNELHQINDNLWEIPKSGGMHVPGRIYASKALMQKIHEGESLKQVANVAHLPGIINFSLAMPDIHWGYGFPIGGVAATDAVSGVISPGGVGMTLIVVSDCSERVSAQISSGRKSKTLSQHYFRRCPAVSVHMALFGN